jgi:hypothetical protein
VLLSADEASDKLDVVAVLFLALRGDDRRTVCSAAVDAVLGADDGGEGARSKDSVAGGVEETGDEVGLAESDDGGVDWGVPGSGIVDSDWEDISTSWFEAGGSSVSMGAKSRRGTSGEVTSG